MSDDSSRNGCRHSFEDWLQVCTHHGLLPLDFPHLLLNFASSAHSKNTKWWGHKWLRHEQGLPCKLPLRWLDAKWHWLCCLLDRLGRLHISVRKRKHKGKSVLHFLVPVHVLSNNRKFDCIIRNHTNIVNHILHHIHSHNASYMPRLSLAPDAQEILR